MLFPLPPSPLHSPSLPLPFPSLPSLSPSPSLPSPDILAHITLWSFLTTAATYSVAGIGALITMRRKKVGGVYCGVLILFAILKSLTADLITSEICSTAWLALHQHFVST